MFENRLIARRILLADPPDPQQEHAQRMLAALIHQRAGHHHVVDEVARQEPVVGANVGLAADHAAPVPSAARIKLDDAMQQSHPPAGNA
jgi:hypothetical protein